MKKTQVRNTVVGALAVGALGYLAGILTAPKKGSETRADIKEGAIKTKAQAEKTFKKAHEELGDLIDKTQVLAKKSSSKAKVELDKAVSNGKTAKTKLREVLSSLHDGDVKDEDLASVIKESTQAIEHLRKYLKNANKA